ncbi:site-specific DNA-methyltransferase [uncultured Phascolarctobacterium sp.]|jgi:adenine-specific DNA-methyltransferase|uniref:site-specific DNA-methyltransferase n=1 Tax=Phascolarctobacterium faecium TaxID=33025 RepID=UPI00258D156B|nr:site-specific DNA-methyltransferase [uncultured Phascolarctobacterium sp.]
MGNYKMRMESVDMTAQNIEKIGAMFPNCITETIDENGKPKKAINFELLKQMLADEVIDGDEAYEFTWVGKKAAIVEAHKPIRKTLRPCKEESKDWDKTENLYIEGDNLEVLKLLQESYLNKVKMIYIDPPYNTGKNYIYRNDFSVDSDEYDEKAGLIDEDGARLVSNPIGSARYHSVWLSMMYQRLLLARNLLTDDGVLVCAIDENELFSLGMILKGIFGEGIYDHVCVSVVHNPRGQQGKNFSYTNEYAIFVFPKAIKAIADKRINDEDVSWSPLRNWGSESERADAKNCFYPVIVQNDKIIGFGDVSPDDYHPTQTVKDGDIYYVYPIDRQGIERKWRYARQTVESIWGMLRPKKISGGYDIELGKTFGVQKTIWDEKKYDANEYGSKIVSSLVPGGGFSFPKSLYTVYDSVYAATAYDKEAIVMDFFSGSGTTAHAVMKLNAEDGGHRKFIMVQLPEDLNEAVSRPGLDARLKSNIEATISFLNEQGYEPTICSIGEERIRKAGESIKNDYPNVTLLDTGFRVLKLDDSNMTDVYYSADEYDQNMLSKLESNVKADRSDIDLLFGCLLEWGLPLSLPYKSEQIEGCTVHTYNDGDLIACFDKNISNNVIKTIAKRKPLRAVFRDSSFANSPAKINVTEIFKLLAPDTRVKVI